MKSSAFLLCTLIASALLLTSPQPARAQEGGEVSFDLFYQALEPMGHWIQIDDYGYAWQPYSAAESPDWRPYTIGSWAHTDAGWTWMSEEEFGWAVYHYGRWIKLNDIGWAWIPGYEWAPAWVTWRQSSDDEYMGWAPLPPEARYEPTIGFSTWVDDYYDIGPMSYNFVHVRDFCGHRLRSVVLPCERNVLIIQNTVNITNIYYQSTVMNHIFIGGPKLGYLATHCREPVRRYTLEADDGSALRRFQHDPRAGSHGLFTHRGDHVIVAAPHFSAPNFAQLIAPKAIKHHVDSSVVDRGWQGHNMEKMQAKIREKMRHDADRNQPPSFPKKEMHTHPIVSNTPPTRNRDSDRPNKTNDPVIKRPLQPGQSPSTVVIQQPPTKVTDPIIRRPGFPGNGPSTIVSQPPNKDVRRATPVIDTPPNITNKPQSKQPPVYPKKQDNGPSQRPSTVVTQPPTFTNKPPVKQPPVYPKKKDSGPSASELADMARQRAAQQDAQRQREFEARRASAAQDAQKQMLNQQREAAARAAKAAVQNTAKQFQVQQREAAERANRQAMADEARRRAMQQQQQNNNRPQVQQPRSQPQGGNFSPSQSNTRQQPTGGGSNGRRDDDDKRKKR